SGSWSNAGRISETGSTVNLGGTFTVVGLGNFSRSGGTVNLTGTLSNSGATLALDATTGSWNLAGGTVSGGTVSVTGGAELVGTPSGGNLNGGVTLKGDPNQARPVVLDLTQGSNVYAETDGGLTLDNATVSIGGTGTNYWGSL